ncbi:MAG: alpha-galactosidase [Armatimonadetes bacterium]|nr:alpha-galactosidase [Armatimonadota bacterium]
MKGFETAGPGAPPVRSPDTTVPTILLLPSMARASSPTPAEMDAARRWIAAKFVDGRTPSLGDPPILEPPPPPQNATPPLSFTYDGQPSADLLNSWERQRETQILDDHRTRHTLGWTDPETGLVIRCVAVEYHDFPTVEWTLYFRNTGTADTPILEDIQALDTRLEQCQPLSPFILYHHTGTLVTAHDYEPHQTILEPNQELRCAPSGGRPCGTAYPYFNLQWLSEGLIVVIGWPGQWAARFTRDEETGLRVRAGQEFTRFRLRPGEEVRTPLIVLQFWKGDRVHAQNVWRRWMVAHNLPRPGGKPVAPQVAACSSHQFGEMIHANEANQIQFVDRYLAEGLKIDYWWMDAGWYVNETGWLNTGTWEVDTKRFPRGLRAITDHAHARGVRSLVWFEPERVTPGTWLYQNHPEWLLGAGGGQKLLDMGNPEARGWLTDHVSRLITEQGIDLYRQDFNMDPLPYWRAADAQDRQGITESRYVAGYLAYWDELRRRFPHMLIDTCAGGGHRNDLETLRRAVPLLRSDYIFEPIGQQCHTYGLSFWVPFQGTGVIATDAYAFRSIMGAHITTCWDVRREDLDYDLLRHLVAQWRRVAPCYWGDYYPLTPYTLDSAHWLAWQFDRPDRGEGLVQAFRRADSAYESARFRLHGLDPDARYAVIDLDAPRSRTLMTGRALMEDGLSVAIREQPGAVVISYRRGERK